MSKKIRVHIIHHTHWDMEWYFTKNDTSALLNFDLKFLLENLERHPHESFLFDGQTAPFEQYVTDSRLKAHMVKLIQAKRLKIGPWYSQPDMRQTTDEGILRNYHYGSQWANINVDHYHYIYNPDSFGFGENIPLLLKTLKKDFMILWRGVNRKAINNAPLFTWKTSSGTAITVYNIASGYFVGRYLYDDASLEKLYQTNILPSIKWQSMNGKYDVVALPCGGDQQPYNVQLKKVIHKLNQKDDGHEYVLSDWNTFIKELKPQMRDLTTYQGSLTFAYGGRLHKSIGAHRPDIKQLLFKNELRASRILEPLYMLSQMGQQYYPQAQLDVMWKHILLSQAHDAYAGCNSDVVNHEIFHRLKIAENIYEANKDMIMRFMLQNEKPGILAIFNPTVFAGENTFYAQIASTTRQFKIVDKQNHEIPYFILSTTRYDGGSDVTYTAHGEQEHLRPDYYVANIAFITTVKSMTITKLQIESGTANLDYISSFSHSYHHKTMEIQSHQKQMTWDIMFQLDAGDSYDLDTYEEIKPLSLKDAQLIKKTTRTFNNIAQTTYHFQIKLPTNIDGWIKHELQQIVTFKIEILETETMNIKLSFKNVPTHLLCQLKFNKFTNQQSHTVASHGGVITRANQINSHLVDKQALREKMLSLDLTHGYLKSKPFDLFSLDAREYEINHHGDLIFNVFRTPALLGQDNLRVRPGRASGRPDQKIYVPHATAVINDLQFTFHLRNHDPNDFHFMERALIQDLTRHNQNIYQSHNRTETWTLPDIQIDDDFNRRIIIDHQLNLLAWFQDGDKQVLRLNNPSQQKIQATINCNGHIETVEFNENEIKEWSFR